MDRLKPLIAVATLQILVDLLRSLFHDEFSVCLRTQRAAGALPQKRALFLYKVLGEVAALTDQLHIYQRHLLDAGRTGQVRLDLLSAMAEVVSQLDKQLRYLSAAVRAIHPAWELKPQPVVKNLAQWVTESVGARRFLTELRWETARQAGNGAHWQQAVADTLDHLLIELDANQRQIQDGVAAVRRFLMAEFTFSEEFFPK
jgi:hypothetical protein